MNDEKVCFASEHRFRKGGELGIGDSGWGLFIFLGGLLEGECAAADGMVLWRWVELWDTSFVDKQRRAN